MSKTNNLPPQSKVKYQYLAGLQESTGEIIYSRAHHDLIYTADGDSYVDGGNSYFRSGWTRERLKQIVIELEVSPATLYNDWNYKRDRFGRIKPISSLDSNPPKYIYGEGLKIVPENEIEDRNSFEYKKKYLMWGTYGKEEKGPRRMIMLATDAETDHLEAILKTQSHVVGGTREIIESILSDRK